MAAVTLEEVTKVYPNGQEAVHELDLAIADGEFLVLVGPSGCGKDITSGTVQIGDRVVNELPAKDRDVAMVFQNYALYPHMTVAQNIGFALKLRGEAKSQIAERVRGAARTLQLEDWLDRKPAQLSGGQRQRVAMGRAIVRDPAVFLLDEPLSNLDAKLRVQMRAEIARIQRDLETTTIYVTHDQVEAMTMGDRVAVMREGRLQQVAEPEELYEHPCNVFVGAFIGSPSMNLLEGRIDVEGDGAVLTLGQHRLDLPAAVLAALPSLRSYDGRDLVVGIRPEVLSDGASIGDGAGAKLRAQVELREALGGELILHLRTAVRPAVTEDTMHVAADVDSAAIEALEKSASHGETLIIAKFDGRSRVRMGDTVDVAVDVERLHFFDPASGEALAR